MCQLQVLCQLRRHLKIFMGMTNRIGKWQVLLNMSVSKLDFPSFSYVVNDKCSFFLLFRLFRGGGEMVLSFFSSSLRDKIWREKNKDHAG